LHKLYIEFSISGIIVTDEEKSGVVTEELSQLVAAFLKNKKIVELQNSFSSIKEDEFADLQMPVGEA
jgi:type II secretory pathway component PulC